MSNTMNIVFGSGVFLREVKQLFLLKSKCYPMVNIHEMNATNYPDAF